MMRQILWVVSLVTAAVLAAGCGEKKTPTTEPGTETGLDPQRLQSENAALRQQLTDIQREKASLTRDVATLRQDVTSAKTASDGWKTKYDELTKSSAGLGAVLPPEVRKSFLDIAGGTGPWELGAGGTIKASSDVLFEPGQARLSAKGEEAIRAIAPRLKEIVTDPRVLLRVDGHTDDQPIVRSGWEDNMHLSIMRARAVVKCLASEGVPESRMFTAGYGPWHPVTSNADKPGQAQNRRVEMCLVSAPQPERGK